MWQDWVIMGVQCGFIGALVPTIRDPVAKPPLTTCVLTVVGIAVMAFCMFTLSMWASGVLLSVMAILWGIIGYQRHLIDRAKAQERTVIHASLRV